MRRRAAVLHQHRHCQHDILVVPASQAAPLPNSSGSGSGVSRGASSSSTGLSSTGGASIGSASAGGGGIVGSGSSAMHICSALVFAVSSMSVMLAFTW